MNGMLLKEHQLELRDDGTVRSIGKLWQLDKWSPDGGVEFRCSSTQEGMESARLDVWNRKADAGPNSKEAERLKLMGYAGSAANPQARGVEGCTPGTSGAEISDSAKDAQDISLLSTLIAQWRETPELSKVRSWQVVPDATNRSQTGLGVELVHYIAKQIGLKGFKKRKGTEGHDIPVVVREPPGSAFHAEALALWRERVAEEDAFPPIRAKEDQEIFTSLGNGHFFQALNCYDCELTAINDASGYHYTIGQDKLLSEAIQGGVPSIILAHATPRPVRAKIAELLNSKRDFFWTLAEDGTIDVSKMQEDTSYCSQFEWLSKGMDAVQVNCLVRSHLGIKDSKRIVG
jgi:hypothetical protein